MPAEAFESFARDCERQNINLHGFVCLKNGRLVAEGYCAPYDAHTTHQINSISKSFTSAAVGMLMGDGLVKPDDRVISYFPEKSALIRDEKMRRATVRHLLSMTLGLTDPEYKRPILDTFFSSELPAEPGTHFSYCTMGVYVLSHIVTRVTGKSLFDFLNARMFVPMGFEAPWWEHYESAGVSSGGVGLHITARDLAKFGQLLIDGGRWEGRQIIPEAYVREATSALTPSYANARHSFRYGYGLLIWRWRYGFGGFGIWGQMLYCLPEQGLVFAVNGCDEDVEAITAAFERNIMPASCPAGADGAPYTYSGTFLSRFASGSPLPAADFRFENNRTGVSTVSCRPAGDGAELVINGAKLGIAGISGWREVKNPPFYGLSPCLSRAWCAGNELGFVFYSIQHNQTAVLRIDRGAGRAECLYIPGAADPRSTINIHITEE